MASANTIVEGHDAYRHFLLSFSSKSGNEKYIPALAVRRERGEREET